MSPEFSDIHCSLGASRSLTDPVTNWTLISGVRLDRDLCSMLLAGKYPARLLGSFLHEFVHHWCFHSPVGRALTHLQLRARRSVLLLAKTHRSIDLSFDLLEDVARYEAAITLMRPLAEGLALFAEFDVMPGESNVISAPLSWTYFSLHSLTQAEVEGEPYVQLPDLLARHRLSDACCDRKSDLLVEPLTCANGGYLPGYLMVKNLWYIMLRERGCSRFEDKDLYLCYLRSFFYEDFGLVATLLDPDVAELEAIQNISIYLQSRLGAFAEKTTDQIISSFEETVSKRVPGNGLTVDDILDLVGEPGQNLLGRQRLQAMETNVNLIAPSETLEDHLKLRDVWTLAQRELMCVGSFRERVRVNKNRMVHIGQLGGTEELDLDFVMPVLVTGALDGVEPQEGEGVVEFFISPSLGYRLYTASLNGKPIAVKFLSGNAPEALLEQISQYRTDYELASSEKKLFHNLIEDMIEKEGLDSLLAHYRSEMQSICDDTYQMRALVYTPDDALEACIETMRETGFYDILGQDSAMVRAVARLSLANSLALNREFAEEVLALDGIVLDELLARTEQASARYRVPIVRGFNESVISLI